MTHTVDPQLLERPIRILVVGCGGKGLRDEYLNDRINSRTRERLSSRAETPLKSTSAREQRHDESLGVYCPSNTTYGQQLRIFFSASLGLMYNESEGVT